jgi:hypothetical protein
VPEWVACRVRVAKRRIYPILCGELSCVGGWMDIVQFEDDSLLRCGHCIELKIVSTSYLGSSISLGEEHRKQYENLFQHHLNNLKGIPLACRY